MTRVAFVLAERQFLTLASNQHLKAVITGVENHQGKTQLSFQFFRWKCCCSASYVFVNLSECHTCPPSTALSVSLMCFGKGGGYWELCV